MFKKLVSFTLIMMLLFTLTAVAAAAQSSPVNLTLAQAADTAVKNDLTLKLTDEKIKLAERRYNTALVIAQDAPKKYWNTDTQHITNKNEEILNPMQRLADLNELKWTRQNSENSLRISVTKLYYQILQKQQAMDNQKKVISRAKTEYDTKKKVVKQGSMTESALLTYEIAVNEAETALQSMQRELDNMNISLNEKLGFPLDTVIILAKADLPAVKLDMVPVDKLASDTVAASHAVKKLESEKLLKKTEYDILYQNSYIRPDRCDTLEDDLLNLDFDIRDKKIAVELKTRTDYNNLLNLKDDITIKKLDYDQKVKLSDLSKKRYDLGVATYLDFIRAQGDMDTALVDYNKAQLDYYTAVQQFKLDIYPASIDLK